MHTYTQIKQSLDIIWFNTSQKIHQPPFKKGVGKSIGIPYYFEDKYVVYATLNIWFLQRDQWKMVLKNEIINKKLAVYFISF